MRSAKTIRLSSLGLKVLAAYLAGALLSIALAVVVAVWMVRYDALADWELNERVDTLVTQLQFDAHGAPVGLNTHDDDLDWLYDSLPGETAYRVLDAAAEPVFVSGMEGDFWPARHSGGQWQENRFVVEHNGLVLYGVSQAFEHQGRQWYLQFVTSERLTKLIQHKFALPYLGIGIGVFSALLIMAFGLCAYITLRYALKPLRDISDAAAAISHRALHARLNTEGVPAEILPLVDSFNSALARLEYGYRLQQGFLATAAHELKTPLALIRGQIELGVDEHSREFLLQDISRMGRQVQQLLHLAEASEPQNYEFSSVDAENLVFEVTNYLERLASQQGVNLQAVVAPGLVLLSADRGALFTLLKNLLENAIQHSPPGRLVTVRAEPHLISVQDEGPGVAPEHIPNLFVRFWRGADRRDIGAGLGLSICWEIAAAHGWPLQAVRKETGMAFNLLTHSRKKPPNA